MEFKLGRHYEIYCIICIVMSSSTSTQGFSNPWKLDTPTYKLTFYDSLSSNWDTAKKKCDDIDARMIQLDDDDVKEAVYGEIKKASTVNYFWIGATGELRNWNWLDNTPVADNLITWYEPQPDNNGGNENRLIIRKSDNKFGDVKAGFKYAGTICQALRGYCDLNYNPCKNEGTCESTTVGDYSCSCAPGYYGLNCSVEYCAHHENRCKNNGTCNSTPTSTPYYKCDCVGNGYYGDVCEVEYCAHHENPCENNGTCNSTPTSTPFYKCDCVGNGYYGDVCEVEYCAHHENPCKNNGTCNSTHTPTPFYKCDCVGNGYYGDVCEESSIINDKQTNLITIIILVVAVVSFLLIITTAVLVVRKRNNKSTSQPTIRMSQNTTEPTIRMSQDTAEPTIRMSQNTAEPTDNREYATIDGVYSSISDLPQIPVSYPTENSAYENLQSNAESPYTYENC